MDIITKVLRESVNEFIITEKFKKGEKVYIDHKKLDNNDPYVSKDEAENLRKVLSSDMINVAKISRMVYPDLTPEGGQSELQKKTDGEDANGKKYHFRRSEAEKIRSAVSKLQTNMKNVD